MQRYWFEYEVLSENRTSKMAVLGTSAGAAASNAVSTIADFEFTDEQDIKLGKIVSIDNGAPVPIVCEGCSS